MWWVHQLTRVLTLAVAWRVIMLRSASARRLWWSMVGVLVRAGRALPALVQTASVTLCGGTEMKKKTSDQGLESRDSNIYSFVVQPSAPLFPRDQNLKPDTPSS